MILGVFSHQKWGRKKKLILKTPYLYTWFSLSSQKYRKMIKDLYFISGLYPDLAKSSKGWLSLFLHLLMDGLHFGYKQKFLEKNTGTWTSQCWCFFPSKIHHFLNKEIEKLLFF
jgi:hypothetical protein